MREIKFRAWDKEDKRMWWNVQDAYDTLGSHHTPDPNADKGDHDDLLENNFGDVLESDKYIVMQFTGLLDKNGKEIYEGDILHPVGEKDKSYNIVVDIDLPKIGGSDLTHWIVWPEDNEIVGNIYENPELLTKGETK